MKNFNCGKILKFAAVVMIIAAFFVGPSVMNAMRNMGLRSMSVVAGIVSFVSIITGALLLYAFGDIADNTMRIRKSLEGNDSALINDSPSKGEVSSLDKLDHIYWCSSCNTAFSSANLRRLTCPSCRNLLSETTILTEDWRKLPQDVKGAIKKAFAKGEFLRTDSNIKEPVQIDELLSMFESETK